MLAATPGITAAEPGAQAEVKAVSVDGKLDGDKGRLVIQADLVGLGGIRTPSVYGSTLHHRITVSRDKLSHAVAFKTDAIQGDLREIHWTLAGTGEVRSVTSTNLEDWAVRQGEGGTRILVLRLKKSEQPLTAVSGQITAETPLGDLPAKATPLAFHGQPPSLAGGFIRVDGPADLDVQAPNPSGLIPVEIQYLPESLREPTNNTAAPLAFRFQGEPYTLPLAVTTADPEARSVVLSDYRLTGQLSDGQALFALHAIAKVRNPKGGTLDLLSGGAALTAVANTGKGRLTPRESRLAVVFDQAGDFPIELQFGALVRQTNGWNEVDFTVAGAPLSPVALRGLGADSQVRFGGAAKPQRAGAEFTAHLPANGKVQLAWKEARAEAEGTLFYAAEALLQIAISPGLMRQTAWFDGKVMQGDLQRVAFRLRGPGEITRVQGPQLLAWTVDPISGGTDRRLTVQFNQPQKEQFQVQIQIESPLGTFPQTVEALQIQPENATRFGGYCRVVNAGAVRLEVVESGGLSQISPEQFPQTDASKSLLPAQTTQTFAYRFSGGAFRLQVQADNILPELTVSQLLAYHLGETDLAIEAEFELDVREAPLRELNLRVPKGYGVARLNASGLSDYFVTDPPDAAEAQLRLVYGSPVIGRQIVQLRLERNKPLGETTWRLPRIDVVKAKSVRGHIGVAADAGFRLTPGATQGLTDIATAFFPKKLPGIQAAFRFSEPTWTASLAIERLPQSILVDAFHLFTVGEGVAYGSSLLNYAIAGAPLGTFTVELSDEYFNVEFTGKDVRNWQKTTNGYVVQLHTPVAGSYTLLAAYERPFKRQGDQLAFTGARPRDAHSEQGHTLVVSAYPFNVHPVNLSSGLLPLEPGEVPAEYRLFFDAPILAAYRYSARPFQLQLVLEPLAQGETVSQVIDRAALTTRISEEGQVVTEARYFVKNKGAPHLRLAAPEGTELWSVTVNGTTVVPVTNDRAHLIPLPQHADPNTVNEVQVKIAARAKNPKRLTVTGPIVSAPVLLAEWRLEPDPGRRLRYVAGTLTPTPQTPSAGHGLAGLTPDARQQLAIGLGIAAVLILIGAILWRSTTAQGVHRFSGRHLMGGLIALAACILAIVTLAVSLQHSGTSTRVQPARDLHFVAPVQQAESVLTAEVSNLEIQAAGYAWVGLLWPVVLAAAVWLYAWITAKSWLRILSLALFWTALFRAALGSDAVLPAILGVAATFTLLQVVLPGLWRWWQVPQKPAAEPGAAAAAVSLLLAGLYLLEPGPATAQTTTPPTPASRRLPPIAESVLHQLRVEEEFVFGSARIRWQATQGDVLPLLAEPHVLTRWTCPADAGRLVQTTVEPLRRYALLAEKTGWIEAEFQYQTRVQSPGGSRGFLLPAAQGLVNRADLTLVGLDVDMDVPQAVAVQRQPSPTPTNAVFQLVLSPGDNTWIGWKPRSRDTRREKAVFYAEWSQLYVPGAGVLEGLHHVTIRPAQGEINELAFDIPTPSTITDVIDPAVAWWRFDPETRRLRVGLSPAQAKPFTLLLKSQIGTGPLPFEQTAGLITVQGAAGQIGLLGIATGNEVQLDDVKADSFAPINLEDFPGNTLDDQRAAVPGLTLRRAYRYTENRGTLSVKAAPVEPDIRVEAQQTLSLGEDRTVLAATLNVEITRAGIFKLSFPLPAGMDVESASGDALSHWTELKTDAQRIVTLHLKSKTEGQHAFALSLTGPGVRAAQAWNVPRLNLREAAKQRGQLLIVPEQGMRLQIQTREGLSQLDPLKAGVRQKGVLAFRLLQDDWKLQLDLERVDAWIQVASLQHVLFTEAQLKVAVNLQYDIENTGVKSLRVRLPANAEGVRFRGDQVADSLPIEGQTNTLTRDWEVKLHRRVIGRFLLQANYTLPVPEQAAAATVVGVEADEVNLQRGFVTLQSGGRLQLHVPGLPPSLQPAEWQSIPRTLQPDIAVAAANHTFRLVEPSFQLAVQLQRHAAAKLLPARVLSVALTSVLSDDGVLFTRASLQIEPGDKRLLHCTLPDKARFWFAFVNQKSVWPWRATNQVLLPIEPNSKSGEPTSVEFFYSWKAGAPQRRALDLSLVGPQFDLPLENIAWRLYLGNQWTLTDSSGSLRLQPAADGRAIAVDLDTYIQNEVAWRKEQTREAEQLLSMGNKLLESGDPEQARRAFQAAYGLSQHDNAFNEDARVQLHNLKMQQALVGLNFRSAKVAGEPDVLANAPRSLREGQTAAYTQQEAKQLLERNTAEDNAVQIKLAERLIQQQDAAAGNPAAIRTTVPEQGRLYTFTRRLQVNPWADLNLRIEAKAASPKTPRTPALLLLGVFGVVTLLIGCCRRRTTPQARA